MSVWVQLVIGRERNGEAFKIKPIPSDINDLKEVVKTKRAKSLEHCDAAVLSVYSPATVLPVQGNQNKLKANLPCSSLPQSSFETFSQANRIRPGKKLEQVIHELMNTSPPTSDEHPFIVVAPTPAPHLPGQGKHLSCSRSPWNEKKCCFN